MAKPFRTGVSGKRKDRLGVPVSLAIALRDDGWYWRDEIVWHKSACMNDRTTRAHEFVLMFTKSERYHYNASAIATPAKPSSLVRARYATTIKGQYIGSPRKSDTERYPEGRSVPAGYFVHAIAKARSVWTISLQRIKIGKHYATFPEELARRCIARRL
jgi:DNA modification methylase